MIAEIVEHFNGELSNKTIAIWGLAFKPYTDDIREAPAIDVINELLLKDVQISAYDPEAMPNMKKLYGDKVYFAPNAYDALKDVDCLLICTEWSEFISPSFDKMKSLMNKFTIFDGSNIFPY